MRPCVLFMLAALSLSPLASAAAQHRTAQLAAAAPAPAADPGDVVSVDAIVRALYSVISGPMGKPRDWNRFRSLFLRGAKLIATAPRPDGTSGLRVFDVEGYVQSVDPYFVKNGFFEREVARRMDRFGNVAHLFSTYESRHAPEDRQPFTRGINSIQLIRDEGRWWLVTVVWDSERPDNPLPTQYLPRVRDR